MKRLIYILGLLCALSVMGKAEKDVKKETPSSLETIIADNYCRRCKNLGLIETSIPCQFCGGKGYEITYTGSTCSTCRGKGSVWEEKWGDWSTCHVCKGNKRAPVKSPCGQCKGSKVNKQYVKCPECGGQYR